MNFISLKKILFHSWLPIFLRKFEIPSVTCSKDSTATNYVQRHYENHYENERWCFHNPVLLRGEISKTKKAKFGICELEILLNGRD